MCHNPHEKGDGTMTGSTDFDCFLSHNSKDKPAARALAARLRSAGVSVWLDEDELPPGHEWQPRLESGIRAAKSIAVLVGGQGMGPWQDQEVQFALNLAVRDRRPVIPVVLPGAPEPADLSSGLAIRTWVDLRPDANGHDSAAFDRLIWGITGVKPGPSGDRDTCAPPTPTAIPADNDRTWDSQRMVLRDLLVALPAWSLVAQRKAFVEAALGGHPAIRDLIWDDDVFTVAGNLVQKLRYFDAVPLPDGSHAICGLLAEVRARDWYLNPQVGLRVSRLADAFGCSIL
jgi:hypothetical protein